MKNIPDPFFGQQLPQLSDIPLAEDEEIVAQERQALTLQASDEWDLIKKWVEAEKKKLFVELTSFLYGVDDLTRVGERTVVYNAVANKLDEFVTWIEENAKSRKIADSAADRRRAATRRK